jgi:hypothetical protein
LKKPRRCSRAACWAIWPSKERPIFWPILACRSNCLSTAHTS